MVLRVGSAATPGIATIGGAQDPYGSNLNVTNNGGGAMGPIAPGGYDATQPVSNVPLSAYDMGAPSAPAANTGGGGGAVIDPMAQTRAKANTLKSALTGIVGNIKGVYDALYGDINVTGSEKSQGVLQTYNQDVQGMTNEFADQFPAIGRGYSARNTYDSSYRVDAEDAARRGFDTTLNQRSAQRDNDLSEVGRWVATQQATAGAERGLVERSFEQLMGSEDPTEIQSAINTMQARLAELESSRAGLRSKASYMDTLNAAVPGGSRLAELRPSLANVIKSQVPTALKRQIASNLINQAGLTPEQAQAALNEFSVQLSSEENVAV